MTAKELIEALRGATPEELRQIAEILAGPVFDTPFDRMQPWTKASDLLGTQTLRRFLPSGFPFVTVEDTR